MTRAGLSRGGTSKTVSFRGITDSVVSLDSLRAVSAPHAPIIQRMGCVYRDKPMFLTVPAALFAATVWTVVLYFFFSILR